MANLGEFSEIINSDNLTLEVGSDNYITLTDLQLRVGRPESRKPTTGGIIYTYGKGDHWFTATLGATTPELAGTAFTNSTTAASFNNLNELDASGDLDSIDWKIVGTNKSAATKTFAATGVLRDYLIRKGTSPDSVEIDIFVRITGDKITVT